MQSKSNSVEAELDPEPEYETAVVVNEPAEVPKYVPQPKIQDGWASGWCEKCHKRYTNAPMVDGVVYCPYHNKL